VAVRRPLPPEVAPHPCRAISAGIVVIGLFSALLVIPGVRAIAGGLLASSAVLAVIIGFASQRRSGTRGGILIALAQPVRLEIASI
jgi:small-conductance mechanosensitive channel